jgi:hypothetical protein
VQDGRAEWGYVEHGPLLSNFCELPVAVVFSGAPLTSFLFGPWFTSVCASPGFRSPPTAANQGCGDAMTSGRTCTLVVLLFSSNSTTHSPSESSVWISTSVLLEEQDVVLLRPFLRQLEHWRL